MLFKLEKPDISGVSVERMQELLMRDDVREVVTRSLAPVYLYWEKARFLNWPQGVSPIEGWAVIKHLRFLILSPFRNDTQVKDASGNFFSLLRSMPWFDDLLHLIDMELGGSIKIAPTDHDGRLQTRLIARGVMEEAIASSQMEGAHTTRVAAKQMLQEGRKPRTRDERMIVNNYSTMVEIERDLKDRPLSLDIVFQMHAMLTKGTLDNDAEVGTFRNDEGKADHERVAVRSMIDDIVYHMPPAASFVRTEMDRLIAYANDDSDLGDVGFMHPVIKAIVLHFWVAYLHPFADGNGRFARALFYWYVLRKGYWGFSYIPLSAAIKQSSDQYGKAYLYTEQDDLDLTYFIDYNLRQIQKARRDFKQYVAEQYKDSSQMARDLREKYNLNDRQVQLLRFFADKEHKSTSLKTHMHIHEISRPTAMRDFRELLELGFVESKRIGKKLYYSSTDKVSAEFNR